MRIKPTLLFASIIIFFLIGVSIFIYRAYFWLPVEKWNESPNKVIVWSDPGCMHIDINYIPTVQVWGDGRIIWIEHNSEGRRIVWEGHITHTEMTQIVNGLINMGFFRFGFGNEKYCVGEFLTVELSSVLSRHRVNPENMKLSEMYSFLKTGAGVISKEFMPETGLLYAYPIEDVGLPADTETEYHWPDDKFGYNLEEVHTQNNGENITGEELQFAWEVVNSKISVVKSNDKMYWIAVEVPGVSR